MRTSQSSSSPKSHEKRPGANGSGNGHSRTHPDEAFPLVLLVDDNEFDRVALDAMLRRHGFRVISAESYPIALAALRSDMPFAGVVVDYYLARPNPKDDTKLAGKVEFSTEPNGFDLLLEAKRLRPGAARILITTDPIAENLEPLFGGRWFNKHNSAGGLVRLLREMLGVRGH